ncbi:MAG: restriction endonuclease subunit S [Acidobacteria bacterium]|nr:MAG: restriction endonuclease subunit S [Acidobacteriota bacterium]
MSEWRRVQLSDLLTFGNGKRKPSTSGDIPIYGGNGILGFSNESNYQGETIIIGRVGAYCGSVYYETKPIWVSDNALSAKPKSDNNLRFLYYFLKKVELNQYASGSSHPLVTQTLLNSLEFNICTNPDEQKAIAEVLSSLDDKIDLLHRQNKTLEQMAETLFRQWFVEDAQDDWEDGCIQDIAEFNPQYLLKKGAFSTYVEMKSLSTTTFKPEGYYKRAFTSGMKFKNGDTLLARITPCLENGKTAFITMLKKDEIGWGSTEYIVMRMKPGYHLFISYVIAKDKEFRDFAIGSMTGSSGRQRAQAAVIETYKMKIPPKKVVIKINNQFKGIVEKLIVNSTQIRTLESLRDTLLPKLMSGKIRVSFNN